MKIEVSTEINNNGSVQNSSPVIVPPEASILYQRGVGILYGEQKTASGSDLRIAGAWHLVRAANITDDPESLSAIRAALLPVAEVVLPTLEEQQRRDHKMGMRSPLDKLRITSEKASFMAMLQQMQTLLD